MKRVSWLSRQRRLIIEEGVVVDGGSKIEGRWANGTKLVGAMAERMRTKGEVEPGGTTFLRLVPLNAGRDGRWAGTEPGYRLWGKGRTRYKAPEEQRQENMDTKGEAREREGRETKLVSWYERASRGFPEEGCSWQGGGGAGAARQREKTTTCRRDRALGLGQSEEVVPRVSFSFSFPSRSRALTFRPFRKINQRSTRRLPHGSIVHSFAQLYAAGCLLHSILNNAQLHQVSHRRLRHQLMSKIIHQSI